MQWHQYIVNVAQYTFCDYLSDPPKKRPDRCALVLFLILDRVGLDRVGLGCRVHCRALGVVLEYNL